MMAEADSDEEPTDLYTDMLENATCFVCAELFVKPRLLPCYHVLCDVCLRQHIDAWSSARKFKCPQCAYPLSVPDKGVEGFEESSLQVGIVECITTMYEIENGRHKKAIMCSMCADQGRDEAEAAVMCPECVDSMCEPCRTIHETRKPDHTTIPCSEMSRHQLLKVLQKNQGTMCDIHNKRIILFCEVCSMMMCVLCPRKPHRNHKKISIKAAFEKHKNILVERKHYLAKRKAELDELLKQTRLKRKLEKKRREEKKRKLMEQQDQLVRLVRERTQEITDEITRKTDAAAEKFNGYIHDLRAKSAKLLTYSGDLDFYMAQADDEDEELGEDGLPVNFDPAYLENIENTLQEFENEPDPDLTYDVSVDMTPLLKIENELMPQLLKHMEECAVNNASEQEFSMVGY